MQLLLFRLSFILRFNIGQQKRTLEATTLEDLRGAYLYKTPKKDEDFELSLAQNPSIRKCDEVHHYEVMNEQGKDAIIQTIADTFFIQNLSLLVSLVSMFTFFIYM